MGNRQDRVSIKAAFKTDRYGDCLKASYETGKDRSIRSEQHSMSNMTASPECVN